MSVLHLTFSVRELRLKWDEGNVINGGLRPLCASCEYPLRRRGIKEGVNIALSILCFACSEQHNWNFEDLGECQITLPVKVLSCDNCKERLWHNTETDEWECVFCD